MQRSRLLLVVIPSMVFFVFSGLRLSAQCDPEVVVKFYFGFLDNERVVFYNQSEGYSRLEWDFGGAEVIREDDLSVLVRIEEGDTSLVCLRAWNAEGCSVEVCKKVFRGAPDEMCRWTDCVWPGDANGDGKANNYDLLNIALGYGASGPQREAIPFPDDPIAWAPNYSAEWDQYLQAVNFKHLDCDGDGYVGEEDVQAIYRNYRPERQLTSVPAPGSPPVFFQFEDDRIEVLDAKGEGVEVIADLYVGSEALPVENWSGLAFDLRFPDNLIQSGSFRIELADDAFLGGREEVMTLHQELPGEGRVDLAISRKQNAGVSGNGKVASISFVIISDIIINLLEPELPLELTMERMRVVGPDGLEREFDLPEITTRVTLVRDLISSSGAPVVEEAVRLFPNPAHDHLQIKAPGLELRSGRLFNLLGQQLRLWRLSGQEAQVTTVELPSGVYLLHLETDQGTVVRKVMLDPQ